jgi:hypothetical protein
MNGIRIGTLVTVLALGTRLLAAQQPGPPNRGGMMADTGMAQQQMRIMDSMNLRLDSLVARMNQATGNKKVAALADVINELVSQRRAMQQHMRQMMQGHMRQMMQERHGMMGDTMGEARQPTKRQPMPTPDSSAADSGHAGHHSTQ